MDTCSTRLLRTAFVPAATLRWVENGHPQVLTQLGWWQRLEASQPCKAATTRTFTVLDREGPLALIEAEALFDTHRFHDLMLAVETPAGWRIVDKVFERRGPKEAVATHRGDEAAIREVIAEKIEAHAAYDPALLGKSHLHDCAYTRVFVEGTTYARVGLSEAAAGYAARRELGETDRESPWKVLLVRHSGSIAAVKLDVVYRGIRYVDHLLLLRTTEGWRIAAAAWGDPLRGVPKAGG